MPQSEGGYISLGNGAKSVYNATTEPTAPQSVFESVKRAIGQVVGNSNNGSQDTVLLTPKSIQPFIVGTRDRDKIGKTLNTKMPSAPAHTAEEARLLGTMPVDPMDDIELRSVQLQFPNSQGSIIDSCDLKRVPTDKGDILVAIQGDTSKPAILTYHDLGLNYATNFGGFFNFPLMKGLLENFCIYHITAPGQEEGAPTLPEDYVYPTMDELAAQLSFVLSHFGRKKVIGFGVGAGANILARFALQNPDKVAALCLVNCVSTVSGWIEWGYQSFNARFLRTKGMTQSVVDYLMWHHFGRNPEERNHDLVQMYKTHFERAVNPTNLAMFINSYIHRNDLNIARTPPGTPQSTCTLKMPVINITGALSPHVDDTVTLNGRLDPTNSTWMKISDCAMVLEEQPGKLAEAFRLFLQGEGYAPLSRPSTPTASNGRFNSYSTTTASAGSAAGAITATGRYNNIKNQQNDFSNGNGNGNNNNSGLTSIIIDGINNNNNSNNINNNNGNNNNTNNNNNCNGIISVTTNTPLLASSLSSTSSMSSLSSQIITTSATKSQIGPIRITENPLPETVAC